MWLMLQQEKADDYVIATGKAYSVREFLNLVFEHAELTVQKHVETDTRLFRPHEVPFLLGDSTKAQNVLNWKPTTDLKTLAIMMYENDLKTIKEL
jgi:GDPmannose 4,6-dehydratase